MGICYLNFCKLVNILNLKKKKKYCFSGDADNRVVLDLSKQSLKKVPKQDDAQMIRVLILDDNDLQKIDNIDSYLRIEKVQ